MAQQVSLQNIDGLVQGIKCIVENRHSLLDEDRELLLEAVDVLTKYKRKRRLQNTANILLIVKAAELLTKFFGK